MLANETNKTSTNASPKARFPFLKNIANAIAIKFKTAKTKSAIDTKLILKTSLILQLLKEWKLLKLYQSKVVEHYLKQFLTPKKLSQFLQEG